MGTWTYLGWVGDMFRVELSTHLTANADDFKSGGVKHGPKIFEQRTCHHKPAIHSGILRKESEKLLKNFFIKLRKK